MGDRFITGTRTIHTKTMGDLVRPIIRDTLTGQAALFRPSENVERRAARLNAGTDVPEEYTWYTPEEP